MDGLEMQPVKAFKDTMLDATLGSFEDIAEIGLDSFLEDGIIKDIPIVGSLLRVGKGISSIKDMMTAKRLLVFIQQVQKNEASDQELKNHIEKLNGDTKKVSQELEIILDYIDKQAGYIKAKILGNFYGAFLEQSIDWDGFILLADIVDIISTVDIEMLLDLYKKRKYLANSNFDPNSAKRLDRCSLIDYANGMIVSSVGESHEPWMARINNIGDVFVEIGLKNISNFSFEFNS